MDRYESDLRDKWDSVEVCSAREALRRKPTSIVVEEGRDFHLSPDNERLFHCFARVPLRSFADLQTLGLLPRKIAEEAVRKAIGADDAATYKLATEAGSSAPDTGCGCHDAEIPNRRVTSVGVAGSVRRRYSQLRGFNNPALARVLADHYRAEVAWDDPLAALAHKWVQKFDSKVHLDRPLLIAALEDITVHAGATLTLQKKLTSLYANNVRIHRRARVVPGGNYVKIWASSVVSFLVELQTVVTATPWRLES